MTRVAVVATGTANLASVLAALRRVGADAVLTHEASVVRDADRVVLPGVGALGAARTRLDEHGMADAIRERVAAQRPLMGICLGMQLLFEGSEEAPGVSGLGVFSGTVRRFQGDAIAVPQLGWNHVHADSGCELLQDGFAYFANSFRVGTDDAPPGCGLATSEHGGDFVAAVERGNLLACQFHPELSGDWGQVLMQRWCAC